MKDLDMSYGSQPRWIVVHMVTMHTGDLLSEVSACKPWGYQNPAVGNLERHWSTGSDSCKISDVWANAKQDQGKHENHQWTPREDSLMDPVWSLVMI